MTTATNLLTRDDTFFGVCEGLGQDLGIPSNALRIAFGIALLLSPFATIAAYIGCGVIVFASRRFFPAVAKTEAKAEAAPLSSDNDAEEITYAKAA